MRHRKATSSSLRCPFCHKPKDQVEQLLAGPRGVYICNTCVDCCQQVMRDASERSSQFPLAKKRSLIVFPYSPVRPSQVAKASGTPNSLTVPCPDVETRAGPRQPLWP